MSEVNIRNAQLAMGLTPDGVFGPKSEARVLQLAQAESDLKRLLESTEADTIPVPPLEIEVSIDDDIPATKKEGSGTYHVALTLGQQALAWCLEEAERWGNKQVPDEQVARYFLTCTRIGTAGKDYSFCAAAQGYAEEHAPGIPVAQLPPHRAGALEIMADAKAGRRPNERWLPEDLAWSLDAKASQRVAPGSLAIYQNRVDPTKGHVERVIECSPKGYRSVGANENNRRWVVDKIHIPWSATEKSDGSQRLTLLGFVVPLEVQS